MSSLLKLPRDQVESLRPRDLQLYLNSRGWVADEGESSHLATVFHRPSVKDLEILLPLRKELGDFALRMTDVLQTLAVQERRSLWEVLHDLSSPPSDILRLLVATPGAASGNLPLEEGLQLVRGGRDMLLSAACSVIRPQAFHPEKTLKEASGFIRKCRLGQAERAAFPGQAEQVGFVTTIFAPVPPELEQRSLWVEDKGFLEATEPFARRVTTRLMGSLDLVDHAVKDARLDPILTGVDQGVSANLCDAIVAMRPAGDQARLDIRMSWSRTRPHLPGRVPESVSFARTDFEIIEDASRRLRERAVPRREKFAGKIIALQSEIPSLFEEIGGKVVIRTEVGGQTARVKVVLHREDYKKACDAHRDDSRVSVTGIIHHDIRVRVYELSEPGDFEVLEDL